MYNQSRGNPSNANNHMMNPHNTHVMNPHLAHQQFLQQQQQQMVQQQMMQQQQMLQHQQMVQQQMAEQREAERQMKKLQRLQQKQSELIFGTPNQQLQGLELPRLTKTVAEEFIALNLGVNPTQLNFVKVPEDFGTMKHACTQGGVQKMETSNLYYNTTCVKAGVCKYCGTVHYHYDLDVPQPQTF